ncbi:ankyrin repeat domain-containing protein [Halioxenophilus sp. WMMB6]|uniref:ankyrin repeat domain-containing protein n=1 Tax=Halioxenophilus sp. WMMB6 TaxID=3073815 RepID=UPI00295EADB8|nr:ankyrin repeat domain-containing protein [Halioxenophilus sp. WMMB6]
MQKQLRHLALAAGLTVLASSVVPAANAAKPAADQQLLAAVQHADLNQAQQALAAGADANHLQPDGSSLLAWAVDSQYPAMVQLLLAKGADPNRHNPELPSFSPLLLACERGDIKIVAQLLAAGADVSASSETGIAPLALCAAHTDAATVAALLALGAQVDASDQAGQSALMHAAAAGNSAVVSQLLAKGADANRTTEAGSTPLMFALKSSTDEAALQLLASGADASYTAPDGTTMVQLAMYQQQYALAARFIEQGVDLNAYDRNGNQLLHAAIRAHQPELVQLLLAKGADANALTGKSKVTWRYEVNFTARPYLVYAQSPLLLAAQSGQVAVMRMLVDAGCDTRFTSDDGNNVVLASAQSNAASLAYALELQPDANVTNQLGQTPLHRLLSIGTDSGITNDDIAAMLRLLAKQGARTDIADHGGSTAAELGSREQYRSQADFLAVFSNN